MRIGLGGEEGDYSVAEGTLYLKKYHRRACGKIWAENNSDVRGATFSFAIPVEQTTTTLP
ncbi:MAG TPA: hypothetical protein VKA95_13600 [Nitrososphaeraceae archaeon]|nr:hypothetical protein [Nitrososphaeraceae archaeon]